MARAIIVDGYNLAFASPVIRPTLLKEKHRGRQLLAELLAGYKKALGCDITVVFDGAEGKEQREVRERGIRIIYSQPPFNADRVIKDLAASMKKSRPLTVVTSDRELSHYVRGRQVEVVGSGAFLKMMERDLAIQEAEKPVRVNVKEWLDFFGFKDD